MTRILNRPIRVPRAIPHPRRIYVTTCPECGQSPTSIDEQSRMCYECEDANPHLTFPEIGGTINGR